MTALTSTLPPSAPLSPKKSVRFDDNVNFREVEKLINSDSDMQTLFYTLKEYQSFKQNNKKTIQLMETSRVSVNNHKTCTRGLEGRTESRRVFKFHLRNESKLAVLAEQMVQMEVGEDDPEMIAEAYRAFTKEAEQEAHKLAQIDELYVRENVMAKKVSSPRWGRFAFKRQPRLRKIAGVAA